MKLTPALLMDAYQQVLRSIPFSSATPILKSAGKSFEKRCGGNCIDQSACLKEQLETFEDARVRVLTDKKHYALLVSIQEGLFFLDVYSMMHEPLILRPGCSLFSAAYPHFNGDMSRIETFYDGDELRMTKTIAGVTDTESIVMRIAEDNPHLPEGDSYRRIAMRPTLGSVAIRSLYEGIAVYVAYPLKSGFQVDAEKLFIKTPDGRRLKAQEEGFSKYLERVERSLGLSGSAIISTIFDSAETYYQSRARKNAD